MYELTEIIAEFDTEAAAQVALVRLRMDRIHAQVVGHVPTAASFSLFGRMPLSRSDLTRLSTPFCALAGSYAPSVRRGSMPEW